MGFDAAEACAAAAGAAGGGAGAAAVSAGAGGDAGATVLRDDRVASCAELVAGSGTDAPVRGGDSGVGAAVARGAVGIDDTFADAFGEGAGLTADLGSTRGVDAGFGL